MNQHTDYHIPKHSRRDPLPQKWINFYMVLAKHFSTGSKDPSTKCGCAIVRPDKTFASGGYNNFPNWIKDDPKLYADRTEKNKYVIHAEANAFDNCRDVNFEGYHLFTWPFMPCPECAKRITNNKISVVYAPETPIDKHTRWEPQFKITRQIFEKAGVDLVTLKEKDENEWTILKQSLPTFQAPPIRTSYGTRLRNLLPRW